jgi:hypothetical protein
MKNALFFIGLVATLMTYGQSTDCPLSSAITVDGNPDEWPMNWVNHEDKIFSFNVCSDEKNLYVRVKTDEFYTKRKMGAFGFTLWFDANGKKKRTYGLRFPAGGAEAEERMGQINQVAPTGNTVGEKADFQKTADRMLIANLEILELIGLTDDPITATRSGITNGIKVAIAMDSTGSYTYEALIPFKSYRLSRTQITDLYVGFETGRYVMPKQKPTTKNSPVAGADLSPSQLSRMQGYSSLQGNPNLTYSTDAWVKISLKK